MAPGADGRVDDLLLLHGLLAPWAEVEERVPESVGVGGQHLRLSDSLVSGADGAGPAAYLAPGFVAHVTCLARQGRRGWIRDGGGR